MKMIQGSGTASDYGSYSSNCTLKQLPYKVPVTGLNAVQLYIDIGVVKPTVIQYELIHTCGQEGAVENIVPGEYVIGQDKNNKWFGVFRNFTGASPVCFAIAVTLDEQIYYSEEYCVENGCNPLTLIKGCYGNLDPLLSTDCEGIYFGVHAGTGSPLGNSSVKYQHQLYMRGVEVTLSAIKNSFKQGRTRNFRTEKEKIYQFWSELIPEWYLSEIDAVFYRGEVYIGSTKYLLNETQFEKVEDCLRQWKPVATFKESCLQSFSCEEDACLPPPEECCDPIFDYATVLLLPEESGESGEYPPGLPDEVPESGDFDFAFSTTVVVECIVDGTPVVTGTVESVTGITDGSTVVTCNAFANVRVRVSRGNIFIPGINPLDGSNYYTKVITDNFITFSSPLVNGEFIYIETIPS